MQPSLEEVKKLKSQGNVIPVYKSVIADFLTPVSAFLKLEKDRSHAFLLESVEGGETIARYSFLGSDPFLILHYREGQPANFMQNLRTTMARYKAVKVPNLPPFTGGAVHYYHNVSTPLNIEFAIVGQLTEGQPGHSGIPVLEQAETVEHFRVPGWADNVTGP